MHFRVVIAVWLHISCRLQAMDTLGTMYPARGGVVWGQMMVVLSEVSGSTPPIRGVCITY